MKKEIEEQARVLGNLLYENCEDIDTFGLVNNGTITIYQEFRMNGELKSAVRVFINIIQRTIKVGDAFNGWTLCMANFDNFKYNRTGIEFLKDGQIVATVIYSLLCAEY